MYESNSSAHAGDDTACQRHSDGHGALGGPLSRPALLWEIPINTLYFYEKKTPYIDSALQNWNNTAPLLYICQTSKPQKNAYEASLQRRLQEFKMYVPLFATAVALQYIALIAYFHV